MKNIVQNEDYEQMMFVQWMKRNYPEHRIFAIPNGGLRNKSVAMKIKICGGASGVPDLMIASLKLFIEMKRVKGGFVSAEQKDWINYLNSVGYRAEVCKGFEHAKSLILSILDNQ
jgi:hypothetical protein